MHRYATFVWFQWENQSSGDKFIYAVMRTSHINAFIKLSLKKVDWSAMTISKTSQESILAEGSIFAESTLYLNFQESFVRVMSN